MDVDDVAERLYGLPPEEFTAARDDAAKQVGDSEAKTAIKALRKPTMAAHVVNALVRDAPDEVDELLAVGAQLREAMGSKGGKAGDVRELTERRRDIVSRMVSRELPAGVRDDVTATLEAATADPDLGAAVRSGRLVKPLRYAGFGALPDLGDAVATPVPTGTTRVKRAAEKATAPGKTTTKPTPRPKRPPSEPKPTRSAADLSADLSAARQRVLDLAGAVDDAQRRYELAARAAVDARKVLDAAEAERAAAHKAARDAHAEAEKARRELGRLERS